MTTFPVETHDQRSVLGVAFAFSVLAIIAVCLRLLAHQLAHKKWTVSDYFIIAALIFALGLQSISITGVFEAGIGFGHVTDIIADPAYGAGPMTKLSQLIIPLQFLWVLSLSCTKISILCLYLRIFPVRWLVISSWATMSVIVAWAIATILAGCLICRPFAYNWDKTIEGGSCGDQVASFTATGVINLVTDVIVLVLPMPSLSRLQMATYKKVTLITVFGLGLVTCVISALRISVLSTMDFNDITYTIPKANIFSGIEPCLAVVLASVPLMRPLLGRNDSKKGTRATPYYDSNSNGNLNSNPYAKPNGIQGKRSSRTSDGFQPLDDDTSQLWLRPMEGKHYAGISVKKMSQPLDEDDDSEESSSERPPGYPKGRGITVRQEWDVRESR